MFLVFCEYEKQKYQKRDTTKTFLWNPWLVVQALIFMRFGVFFPVWALGLLHLAAVGAAILMVGTTILVGTAILQMLVATVGDLGGSVGDRAVGAGPLVFTAEFLVVLGQPLALGVGLVPEVGEQHEEEGAVHPDEM